MKEMVYVRRAKQEGYIELEFPKDVVLEGSMNFHGDDTFVMADNIFELAPGILSFYSVLSRKEEEKHALNVAFDFSHITLINWNFPGNEWVNAFLVAVIEYEVDAHIITELPEYEDWKKHGEYGDYAALDDSALDVKELIGSVDYLVLKDEDCAIFGGYPAAVVLLPDDELLVVLNEKLYKQGE